MIRLGELGARIAVATVLQEKGQTLIPDRRKAFQNGKVKCLLDASERVVRQRLLRAFRRETKLRNSLSRCAELGDARSSPVEGFGLGWRLRSGSRGEARSRRGNS